MSARTDLYRALMSAPTKFPVHWRTVCCSAPQVKELLLYNDYVRHKGDRLTKEELLGFDTNSLRSEHAARFTFNKLEGPPAPFFGPGARVRAVTPDEDEDEDEDTF